jgi:hypothetical protein
MVLPPGPGSQVWVSAHSEGDGSDPRGEVIVQNLLNGLTITAEVVCLDVKGNKAAVGATIVETNWPPSMFQVGSGIVEYFVDDGSSGAGVDRWVTTRVAGEGCSVGWIPYIPVDWWTTVEQGNFVVVDGD